jgi:hypothetical protein
MSDYKQSFGNDAAAVRFETLPTLGIEGFMVLGPFVVKTDGAFETEYFYEREKILGIDYLASSGGEGAQVPFVGQAVRNDYYGPDFLKWRAVGATDNGSVRFRDGAEDFSQALFSTEQRNCVNYAAL